MHTRVGRISLFLEISKRLVLYVCKIVRKKSCQNFRALDQYHLPQAKYMLHFNSSVKAIYAPMPDFLFGEIHAMASAT